MNHKDPNVLRRILSNVVGYFQRLGHIGANKVRRELRRDPRHHFIAIFVATLLFAIATNLGVFSPPAQPALPENVAKLSTLSRQHLDERIKKDPKEISDITFFGDLQTVVVQMGDSPRRVQVFYNEPDLLLQQAREKGIPFSREEPRMTSFMERAHWSWWLIFAALAIAAVVRFISWANSKNNSNSLGVYTATAGGTGTARGTTAADSPLPKVTFDDVAGCDEAVAKIRRVAKWLMAPEWYTLCGAKIPRGCLLLGPPGTGKTLLARAIAGETDSNVIIKSGSDFVEMFVGVGAGRVRKLFEQAKDLYLRTGKKTIIFIDEIDAVGRARHKGGGSGGDSERDQTLNQLLVCMDGFSPLDGILLIAATNRLDILDEALVRPGRFDYKITVDAPNTDGREAIFGVHTRKMSLHPEVSLRELAVRTPRMVGADIAFICNEAATICAERLEPLVAGLTLEEKKAYPKLVTRDDFDKAIDNHQFGDALESKNAAQAEEEQWNTSVHEAGHAAVPQVKGGPSVTKLTRMMRSKSLGMMQAHDIEERYSQREAELRNMLVMAFAGRAAQEVILEVRDTGADNDFEKANMIARVMVARLGMSPLGTLSMPVDQNGFPTVRLGNRLLDDFDDAWRKISNDCYAEAVALVKEHKDRIIKIAKALMAEETILGDRFRQLWDEPGEYVPRDAQVARTEQPATIPDATGYSGE